MRCRHQTNLRACLLVFLVASASAAPVSSPGPVDFNRDIRPIFETRCYECHGADKQKNGYRLDRKADAFHGGDSGHPAILPGQSSASPLIQRLITQENDEKMPPKGERLSAGQIDHLRAWIDAGAVWPETAQTPPAGRQLSAGLHWAFQAPVSPALPAVRNKHWIRNPGMPSSLPGWKRKKSNLHLKRIVRL